MRRWNIKSCDPLKEKVSTHQNWKPSALLKLLRKTDQTSPEILYVEIIQMNTSFFGCMLVCHNANLWHKWGWNPDDHNTKCLHNMVSYWTFQKETQVDYPLMPESILLLTLSLLFVKRSVCFVLILNCFVL